MLLQRLNAVKALNPTGCRASLDLVPTLPKVAAFLAIRNVKITPGAGKVRTVKMIFLVLVQLLERKRFQATLRARITLVLLEGRTGSTEGCFAILTLDCAAYDLETDAAVEVPVDVFLRQVLVAD